MPGSIRETAYVYAQNQVSVMLEQLTGLDEMAPFADIVSEAEDLYMPSGLPISPLTTSYFIGWAFFDACVGSANETIGTTVLELGAAFGMHAELLRLIRLMQESRMGLYVHKGTEDSLVALRDICQRRRVPRHLPCRLSRQEGRAMVYTPIRGGAEHVVFTTPYIVLQPGLQDWQAYFRRTLPEAPQQARLDAYAAT